MDEIKVLKTVDEIRVFSDPYRLQILNCFYSFNEPATVKQVANEMGEVPANVHYHVKKMEKCGIVKLVYTKEINGIIAKYYEPAAKRFDIGRSDIAEPIQKAALDETRVMITTTYNESLKTFLEAVKSDGERSKRGSISLENVFLTEEEYEQFIKYIGEFYDKYKDRKKADSNVNEYSLFITTIKK
jgi:Bacterial regulatory protein, arsR family.